MENIFYQEHRVTAAQRRHRNGHDSFVVWIYGLSGSGKSTIASAVEKVLFDQGRNTYILDGDNVRLGINKHLGFSPEDRKENQRRIAEIAKLFVDAGIVCLAAFISPLKSDREMAKSIIGADRFIEVFIDTPIEECERRDIKGLYKKARTGQIKNFTGISAPFELPDTSVFRIDTFKYSLEEEVDQIMSLIHARS